MLSLSQNAECSPFFTHPFYVKLKDNVRKKKTCLCVGLDPDPDKIPPHFSRSIKGIQEFLYEVIKATQDLCVAYKPNAAFFEALGLEGIELLLRIREWVPSSIPLIFDGKRGDIENTSKKQARFIFDYLKMDAVTLHPYMGSDSLIPFFEYHNHYSFVLTLTSNKGASDFEMITTRTHHPLYQSVADKCVEWASSFHNIGLVVGGTQSKLQSIRKSVPRLLFLIPGIGEQGGTYHDALHEGANEEGLTLINVSRSLLYCGQGKNFTKTIRKKIIEDYR